VRQVKKLVRFFREEEGVVMVEYGLIAGLIGAALIATLGLLTNGIHDMFWQVIDTLSSS